jgi:hypothetical protein
MSFLQDCCQRFILIWFDSANVGGMGLMLSFRQRIIYPRGLSSSGRAGYGRLNSVWCVFWELIITGLTTILFLFLFPGLIRACMMRIHTWCGYYTRLCSCAKISAE